MATTTPNFGWAVPTSTDLVKDGAVAIETLGDSIDASLVDLKGGTTGQVLAKASNTDMDFSWVAQDDSNAIQNAIVDAKGDLIAATANDTPARLAVGANGETLVADSSTSTGLRYQANAVAGKNKIISGDFSVWQRGTSFSSIANAAYGPDRWSFGTSGDVVNVTQQAFTPADITSIGYGDAKFFCRMQVVSSNGSARMVQKIEDVQTLANQVVTVSFWAKASTATNLDIYISQNFGSGGSTTVTSTIEAVTLTTSWVRYTKTFTLASISGKTIGAGNHLSLELRETSASTNISFDFWGVQVEAGSVATAFQTATGTIQGELAACQRYYWRWNAATQFATVATGAAVSSTVACVTAYHPVPMRTIVSAIDGSANSTFRLQDQVTGFTQTAVSIEVTQQDLLKTELNVTVASGLTQFRFLRYGANNSTSTYLGFSAEL